MTDERELDEAVLENADEGIFKVHRRAFVDPQIFQLEHERIFDKTWLYVGYESEFQKQGQFVTRSIGGRDVIAVRDEDGTIQVLINRCPHRGAIVTTEAAGCAEFFRCPYHAWTFNKKGHLTGVPGQDAYGPNWKKDEMGLNKVPRVESYRGFIFASFDPDIEPLREFLRDAAPMLDLVADQPEAGFEIMPGRNRYCVRANWKLLVESYTDNYHVTMLHGRYLQHYRDNGVPVAPAGQWISHKDAISRGHALGRGHCIGEQQNFAALGRLAGGWGPNLPEWSKEEIAARRASMEKRLGAERAERISIATRNIRIFPTLHLIDQISSVIRLVIPRTVDYCDVEEWVLVPKDESPKMRALRAKNTIIQHGGGSFLSTDDVEMLERTQRGLQNPGMDWVDYARGLKIGRALTSDEQPLRELYREWHERMTLGRTPHPVRT